MLFSMEYKAIVIVKALLNMYTSDQSKFQKKIHEINCRFLKYLCGIYSLFSAILLFVDIVHGGQNL